jgi:nucleoside-diphosphate-sugar epimerase
VAARDPVLVTGAYGLVGRAVVERLVADKFQVIVTAHRTVKPPLPAGVDVRAVDLTEPRQVDAFVAEVAPSAIVHLAAVIPPQCYADRTVARAVNVDATAAMVRAAAALPSPPRFVHASSVAVHGIRNPHRYTDLLTPGTPLVAGDLYSCHKIEAEYIVRSSDLEWSVLRLGGVISLEPFRQYGNLDAFYLGALLPEDGRVHTIDPRDVATAFAAAITTDAVREVFMIAGDDSHKSLQGDVARSNAEAMGLAAALFPGRLGNPDSDADWYPGDWMDTARAQQVLTFQRHSSSEMYAEIRERAGWKARPLRVVAPVFRVLSRRTGPYYKAPGRYADPWGAIRTKWGDPEPDA